MDIKPKDPERRAGLNMGQTCELEDAARRSWPATEPPVDGSLPSGSEGWRVMASQRHEKAEPGERGETPQHEVEKT